MLVHADLEQMQSVKGTEVQVQTDIVQDGAGWFRMVQDCAGGVYCALGGID